MRTDSWPGERKQTKARKNKPKQTKTHKTHKNNCAPASAADAHTNARHVRSELLLWQADPHIKIQTDDETNSQIKMLIEK